MIISEIPSNSSKKVVIECDFKSSQKCKGQYEKVYRNVLKGRDNNDGKDRCIYCFNSLTKSGSDNYNFRYEKKEHFFAEIDSELKAYLLGWVAGDGSIKKDGLSLAVHKDDKEIVDLFCESISSDYVPFYRDYDNTYNIKIHSKFIVKDLCRHLKVGIGNKSDKIVLPDLSEEFLIPFIRGLFDSDGSIGKPWSKKKSPNCNYSSISEQIKDQVKHFCEKKDIDCCISKTMVHWWGDNANKFMDMIYKNSSYHLKRKYDLYEEWSTWISNKGTKNYPRKKRDKSTYNLTGLAWHKERNKL